MSDPEIHAVASLIGEASRATMLVHLMGGRQLPASDLARIARVAPATASEHLAKLVAGGLVQVRQHGRHRYYALASPEVAHIIEGLMSLAPAEPVRSLRGSTRREQLREARTCYDHLAGALGTGLTDAMIAQGWLAYDAIQDTLTLTPAGFHQAEMWGWMLDPHRRMPLVRPCLDWSERRYHAAGQVGREMAAWMFRHEWILRGPADRAVFVTADGRRALAELFHLSWPPSPQTRPGDSQWRRQQEGGGAIHASGADVSSPSS
ncbi:regulatory protein ArsR [Sulfobacillus acidophilus DSM 10332]|uniref:Regulatory protein ArsR n=1 Tax=Sulfobacillus acidophilus (strain ATCC 700253 / DSM 10332 / NAL) TaxID=679936 RepID=G8TZE2_SULAD|nr:regulatory protein ArsR [Sulfobacillus acidophilus DSM 10332]